MSIRRWVGAWYVETSWFGGKWWWCHTNDLVSAIRVRDNVHTQPWTDIGWSPKTIIWFEFIGHNYGLYRERWCLVRMCLVSRMMYAENGILGEIDFNEIEKIKNKHSLHLSEAIMWTTAMSDEDWGKCARNELKPIAIIKVNTAKWVRALRMKWKYTSILRRT